MDRTQEAAGSFPRAPTALVDRVRLDPQIGEEPLPPLTVLVAPVGFGKTQALAGWARRTARAVVWFAVPPHLSGRSGDDVLAPLLEGMSTTRPTAAGPPVVAIDDAHLLTPGAWRSLADWLDSGPRAPVLVAGRGDVPPSLRKNAHLVGAEALRFTDDEAARLVHVVAPDLSPADALAVRTQAGVGRRARPRCASPERSRGRPSSGGRGGAG